MKRIGVSFNDNPWYSNPILTFDNENMVYYDATYEYGQSLTSADVDPTRALFPQNMMLSLSFTQSTTEDSYKAVRNTLESSFRLFGSYLALILRFTGMLLSRFQRFSIDNSMVKKLYTADHPDDKGDKGKKGDKENGEENEEEDGDDDSKMNAFIDADERSNSKLSTDADDN